MSSKNPLERNSPELMLEEMSSHSRGMEEIQKRLAGEPRSVHLDLAMARNYKMLSQAADWLKDRVQLKQETLDMDKVPGA
ncbi:MAG: hypothetical protein LPD71_00005 [Shewanella sp.]|nr:hypothetical protein [Shewanella sp.]MCF1459502.1 hypothetical protein [Shewanella sp.]